MTDLELKRRARAARRLIRLGLLDPLIGLSLVVWPDNTVDDPDAGKSGVDRRHEAAA